MTTAVESSAGHPHNTRAEDIRRLVDAAPPLSDAVRSRIAVLLRPALSGPVAHRDAA